MDELLVSRALADRYVELLKGRLSRGSDGWRQPCLAGNGAVARLLCKYSSAVFLDLSSNGYVAILQLGVRGGRSHITMSDVARFDLSFPDCFDYLDAAYAGLGIVIK